MTIDQKISETPKATPKVIVSILILILSTLVGNKVTANNLVINRFANGQIVRLQMEKTAPNGTPVTINITPQYGFRNGGLVNTWIGVDNDSVYRYLTNGHSINFQRVNSNYSISSTSLNVQPGIPLHTYNSQFSRYQDWILEPLGGPHGDTYHMHWRTDTRTNLCLDIRGFGEGQKLNNEVPVLWHCDRNNPNQRIRVIGLSSQNPAPTGNSTGNNSQSIRSSQAKVNPSTLLFNLGSWSWNRSSRRTQLP